ncbi:peptidylprolyl isomerase [Vallitalea okinawensis]|uniref:peptidylprolyl isomerase n=1 Tax=Vallitalea okinawensis TaxID=2078660 RepID=UPI000CFE2194|nr:peptidylprolyl isomerase [Vallitalea okinawensis]
MQNIIAFMLCIVLTFSTTGCASDNGTVEELNIDAGDYTKQMSLPEDGEEIAIMHTNHGDIYIKLFEEKAPKSVENFKTHATNEYYNGITFHRVIKDFMIQGGDPTGTGAGGESIWGEPFEDEFSKDLLNFRGALSMANAGPGTNGSQFFIVQAPPLDEQTLESMKASGYPEDALNIYREIGGTPWLDFRHSVFGQVFKGMNIVDEIAAVEVGDNDKPVDDIIIESIEIVEWKE